MKKVIVLRSPHLLQNEGEKASLHAYRQSRHRTTLDLVTRSLKDLQIPCVIWNESELIKRSLPTRKDARVVIVPGMRVCTEGAFQRLLTLAESGWVVFAGVSSFYYDRDDAGRTKRVIPKRIKSLYILGDDSYVASRWAENCVFSFRPTRFEWLTKGLPDSVQHSRDGRYVLGVLGASSWLLSHGEMLADAFRSGKGKPVDTDLANQTPPVFLIREFPSEGLFIYACFNFRFFGHLSQVLQNIWRSQVDMVPVNRQVRNLKALVVFLCIIVGLLLAREWAGDTWLAYLGGVVVGVILGVLGNWLTELLNRWYSDS